MILPNVGTNEGKMYGPMLPQAPKADCEDIRDVLEPLHVLGSGAPKKKLKSTSSKSVTKCSLCKRECHNRRTCFMRVEVFLSSTI